MYGSGFDNLLFLLFCDFFMTFIFEKWCKCTFRIKSNEKKNFGIFLPSSMLLTKITGSVSRGADPDPYQNFTDPQHWFIYWTSYFAVYIRIFCNLNFFKPPKNTLSNYFHYRAHCCYYWNSESWDMFQNILLFTTSLPLVDRLDKTWGKIICLITSCTGTCQLCRRKVFLWK